MPPVEGSNLSWSDASCFKEFQASVARLRPVFCTLDNAQGVHGLDHLVATAGLPLLCACLANGCCLITEEPALIMQLSFDQALCLAYPIAYLQLTVDELLNAQHAKADALSVAQCIAKSGLLPAFAAVCSAVADQLCLHKQQCQQQAQQQAEQQTAQQQARRATQLLPRGCQALLHCLLHMWQHLSHWWPGRKLAGARGFAITVQPFAELVVAVVQNIQSFSTLAAATMAPLNSSNSIEGSCLGWLLGQPVQEALQCINQLMHTIAGEVGYDCDPPAGVKQLLGSTAFQMLVAIDLGLMAQGQHRQVQAGSTTATTQPSSSSAAAEGHSVGVVGVQSQQQRHLQLQAAPDHLLLWEALQCPLAEIVLGCGSNHVDGIARVATTVFISCFEQQVLQQTAPGESGTGHTRGRNSSSASHCSTINSSSIAKFQVPYLHLLLVATELQLLYPDARTIYGLYLLSAPLISLMSMSCATPAAARQGPGSLEARMICAVLGPVGLCFRRAHNPNPLASGSAVCSAGGNPAHTIPQQQQQQQQQEEDSPQPVKTRAEQVMLLVYGRLLLQLFATVRQPDWEAVFAQDPATCFSNLELGLRAQAEAEVLADRQQTPTGGTEAAGTDLQESKTAAANLLEFAETAGQNRSSSSAVPQHILKELTVAKKHLVTAVINLTSPLLTVSSSFQLSDNTEGCEAKQEPATAVPTAAEQQQVAMAIVSVLSTNLKVHQAVTQAHTNADTALRICAHAADVLGVLVVLNCGVASTAGAVDEHMQLWGACITLAGRCSIAAGNSVAVLVQNDTATGSANAAAASCLLHGSTPVVELLEAFRTHWRLMLQRIFHGVVWVQQQLLLLLKSTEECATSSTGPSIHPVAAAAAAAGVASSSSHTAAEGSGFSAKQVAIKLLFHRPQLWRIAEQCETVLQLLEPFVARSEQLGAIADKDQIAISSMAGLQLAQQLQQLGNDLCAAVPVPHCCNHPGCCSFRSESEQQLVSGKGCVCGGCQVARYCGRDCQTAHWPQHKAVCKRLKRRQHYSNS